MVGLVLVYLRNSPATAHLTSHNGTVPSAGMNKKPVTGMKPLQTLMQDAFFLHFCIKWTRTWLTELEQTEFPKKFLIVSAFYSPLTRCSLSRVHSFRVEFGAPPCNKLSCTCRAGTLLCRWSTVKEGLKTGWPIVPLCWRAECKTLFLILS